LTRKSLAQPRGRYRFSKATGTCMPRPLADCCRCRKPSAQPQVDSTIAEEQEDAVVPPPPPATVPAHKVMPDSSGYLEASMCDAYGVDVRKVGVPKLVRDFVEVERVPLAGKSHKRTPMPRTSPVFCCRRCSVGGLYLDRLIGRAAAKSTTQLT
jgi:hypothetical protein